jgi:AcrR family transcriptional regulator
MSPDIPTTPVDAAPRRARGRPRKTADERDDGNRRQDLLRAAARLFRSQGFAATSTRDIATAAGMRSGSPFYHFDNKESLLAAVMQEGMVSAVARQAEAMVRATASLKRGQVIAAREAFRVLIRNHFEVLLGPDSDFIPVMLYEWRSLSEAERIEVKRLKDGYEAVWVPVLQALRASGELRGDPALSRLMIFGALNWSVQWFDPSRNASLDDLTEAALQLFLKENE